MPKPIKASELDPELRKQLGIRNRKQNVTMEQIRQESIGVLNQIRHLTKAQRDRILKHALKVNEV